MRTETGYNISWVHSPTREKLLTISEDFISCSLYLRSVEAAIPASCFGGYRLRYIDKAALALLSQSTQTMRWNLQEPQPLCCIPFPLFMHTPPPSRRYMTHAAEKTSLNELSNYVIE
jgi:hypothetical protein